VIPDNGRLLIVEAIIPDDDSPHLAKDLDIRLLAEASFRPGPAVGLSRIESVMAATPAS
jgi:hypothetical protein